MPSNHLILCRPLLLPPSSFPASQSFQMSQFFTQVAKLLEFQLQHQSSQWIFRRRLITLQYRGGFCHILTWISHGCSVHVSPHPETSPHSISLGCPRALALSALLHALNLHWSSILHMVIYVFQCYSLKSSHPHLPQSPKVCSSHLYLFCCLAYRVIITIFLNSIYMR